MNINRSFSKHLLTTAQWQDILRLGDQVEESLQQQQVGLMMGGEPTFIAVEHLMLPEWQTAAMGEHKRQLAQAMLQGLATRLAPAGHLLQYGVGKLYPGEQYPRWAFGCYWRTDGVSLWSTANCSNDGESAAFLAQPDPAQVFMKALVTALGLPVECIIAAWEEQRPAPIGYVLPLLATQTAGGWHWATCDWHLATGERYGSYPLKVTVADVALGQRLPLATIDWSQSLAPELNQPLLALPHLSQEKACVLAPNTIGVALAVEVREGAIAVFLPPIASSCSFVDLVATIEQVAMRLQCCVCLEGYGPPLNAGITGFQITPDPGVLEVNIHPVVDWQSLVHQTFTVDAMARDLGLGTHRYSREGRTLSTGGGAHITIGGTTPAQSPLLQRPDLLQSLLIYWQHHPSLAYLFSGQYVGPTSQSPRMDEVRPDGLYELEVALKLLAQCDPCAPEWVDRLLKPFLTDGTGNAHRTALCIDKLHPVDQPSLQLGLLEFRGFEMPHTPQLRLLQLLLVRALVARCWQTPYTQSLIPWGTQLQDQFFLPHYIQTDWLNVLQDLDEAGFSFAPEWFVPFFTERFPVYGQIDLTDAEGMPLTLELRHALEPWPVLLGEVNPGSSSRPVDDSMERLQVSLCGPRAADYIVLCQGQRLPLSVTDTPECAVAGVRFRARPYRGLTHPVLMPETMLQLEVVDQRSGQSLGGCTYFIHQPDGTPYDTSPQTAAEAAQRLQERVAPLSPQESLVTLPALNVHPAHPLTLDLRWVKGS